MKTAGNQDDFREIERNGPRCNSQTHLHALALLLPLALVALKPAAMLATAAAPVAFAAQLALAVAVLVGPGLAARPFVKCWLPASPVAQGVCIVVHSVAVSAFVPWCLYVLGLYTVAAAQLLVGALFLSLVAGCATFPWKRACMRLAAKIAALPISDKIGLGLGVCLLIGASASSLAPFTAWDAIVSWDKWGRDMAARNGLGGYVMGGYPQLIPSLYSLFYKVFASSDVTAIPDTTYAVHFLNSLFNWMILLGGWLLCRKLKASFLLFIAIFLGNGRFVSGFASGYVDAATTAFFLCTAGLAADWIGRNGAARWRTAFLALLPASAALGFLKGQSYVLTGFVIVFVWAWSRTWKPGKSAPALLALAAGTLPFFAYSVHQSAIWNAGRAEADVLLHSMPMRAGHPELVTRTWAHAMELLGDLFGAYAPAWSDAPRGYAAACGVLLTVALVLALRKRAVVPVALAAAAGWTLWFWNASYDWRNVHQVFALLAACMAAGFRFNVSNPRARLVPAALQGLVAVAASGHLLAASAPASLVAIPPTWRLPAEARPATVFGPGFSLLAASPLARQAAHVYSQNVFTWLLGDKAVYGWHPFVRTVKPTPGDLATVTRRGGKNTAETPDSPRFEVVSGFGTQHLEMVGPAYETVLATLAREGAPDTPQPLPATITAPGVYWLDVTASAAGGDVVLFRVDVAGGSGSRMLVGREWNTLSSFRGLCGFVRDGDAFKALFWLDRAGTGKPLAVPPIAISKTDDRPMTLTAARVQIVKASRNGLRFSQ